MLETCIWLFICKIVAGCLMGWPCVVSNLVLEDVSQDADSAEYFLSLFKLFYILFPICLSFLSGLPVLFERLFPYFHCTIYGQEVILLGLSHLLLWGCSLCFWHIALCGFTFVEREVFFIIGGLFYFCVFSDQFILEKHYSSFGRA